MSSQLTREEVERIAELARLSLTPAEASQFARELTAILEYAAAIGAVNTADVPAADIATTAGWRDDLPAPSLARDAVMAEAPDAVPGAGLFRVPKVL